MEKQPIKHALVTGAARRVGREIAMTLARAGWDITLHCHNSRAEAQDVAAQIRSLGRAANVVQADLEKPQEVENLIAQIQAPPTAFVSNASLFERNENDPDGSRHRAVNVDAPKRLIEALHAKMQENTRVSVVLLQDNTPMPGFLSAYAQSRAALRQALPDLARRYAPQMRINAVAPGPTLRGARESEEHFQKLVDATPLRMPSSPDDIAAAVLFLLTCQSITGQCLAIDSGSHLNFNF